VTSAAAIFKESITYEDQLG